MLVCIYTMVVSCDVHIYTVVNKAKPEYTNKDCYAAIYLEVVIW